MCCAQFCLFMQSKLRIFLFLTTACLPDPDSKYFVYTGNTTYGIQNLEYDPYTNYIFAAVYCGRKPGFPNYPIYVIDMAKDAEVQELKGIGHDGEALALARVGECDEATGIYRYRFGYGDTGIIALGDGNYYFSHDRKTAEEGFTTTVKLYHHDSENGFSPV